MNKKRVLWAADLNGSPLNQFNGNEIEIWADEKNNVYITLNGSTIGKAQLDALKAAEQSELSSNKLKKIKDYFWETTFDVLDYDYAKNEFKKIKPNPDAAFGCSAFRKGSLVGRSFDFTYNNIAQILVHTPALNNHYATIGITRTPKIFTEDFMEKRECVEEYKLIPFCVVDGINEKGLYCNANVVPLDYGTQKPSLPLVEEREVINRKMLVRYIIDNFASADEAIDYIRNYVSVYPNPELGDMNYDTHFMIADLTGANYVIEFVNQQLIVTEQNKMTNFYEFDVNFNNDGTVYTPYTQDNEHDAVKTNNITPYGCGLERWNIITNAYEDLLSVKDFKTLLENIKYTNTYTEEKGADFWYSELVHLEYEDEEEKHILRADTSAATFDSSGVIELAKNAYENRDREAESPYSIWHSVHASVYDLAKQKIYIAVQEDYSDWKEFEIKQNFSEIDNCWEKGIGENSIQTKGTLCEATGDNSIAMGSNTHAGATASHSEGALTATRNDYNEEAGTGFDAAYSHVEGLNNATNNVAEHGEGKFGWSYYDDSHDPSKCSIHYTGIGTNNQEQYRKNAFVIMQNGDIYVKGIGGYNGKDIVFGETKTLQQILAELSNE